MGGTTTEAITPPFLQKIVTNFCTSQKKVVSLQSLMKSGSTYLHYKQHYIPLPKIRQLNKHFFLFMQPFGISLQGCNPARIGAGAAHYKTLSNPLSPAAEPAHRP